MPENAKKNEYQERVLPSLSTYAAMLVIPVSLFLVVLPFGEDLSLYTSVLSSAILLIISFALSPRIHIKDNYLRVGKAIIPLERLGKAEAVRGNEAFIARGRELNPGAYSRFQPGIKDLVKVKINDPKDPTPYWLFSTRNAEILAARLNQNQ